MRGPPGLPMEVGQLGIASKSATGPVELVHLGTEHRLSSVCRDCVCVRNHHCRRRSQRAKRTYLHRQGRVQRGHREVPPDVTTGRVVVVVGGGDVVVVVGGAVGCVVAGA